MASVYCLLERRCVADGQMAVDAYLEATDAATAPHRVQALRHQLLTYCRLDTWAMVWLWGVLVGRKLPVTEAPDRAAESSSTP